MNLSTAALNRLPGLLKGLQGVAGLDGSLGLSKLDLTQSLDKAFSNGKAAPFRQALLNHFDRLDDNSDGSLTLGEARNAFHQAYEVQQMYKHMAMMDGEPGLTQQDVQLSVDQANDRGVLQTPYRNHLLAQFQTIDTNSDGRLDVQELAKDYRNFRQSKASNL